MIRIAVAGLAVGVLAACQPVVPDSGAVVTTTTFEPAQPVVSGPLDGTQPDNADAQAAAAAAAANSGVAPVQASPSNPPPVQLNNPVGISDEQNFDTVSANRSIESDADRIAANRAQYTVVAPTDLPTRPGSDQPNIVEYAVRTSNPVGVQLYPRSRLRASSRTASRCAAFPSADQAQIEFLSQGGPERDRRGLDPDGDGFACGWDPRPFRTARGAVQTNTPAAQQTRVVVPQQDQPAQTYNPLVISSE